jgi:hypothetical protein
MFDMDADNWPLPDYNPGPRQHLHALGVISITFAGFEAHLHSLCPSAAIRQGLEFDIKAFWKLNEKTKIERIREFFSKHEKREDAREAICNLLEYFDWCQHTRNQLLHAERYPAAFGRNDVLYLMKRVDKISSESAHVAMSLKEIRSIAEKVRAGVVQCAELNIYLRYNGAPPEKIDPRYLPFAERLPVKLAVPPRLELALWSD